MVGYPLLRIRLDVIEKNMRAVVAKCAGHGMSVWGVTKGLSAPPELAERIAGTGVAAIADSRISNIKRMRAAGIEAPFALIRVPMRSELEDVIEYADYSLISDTGTLAAMAALCVSKKKTHKAVLMVDVGDLREGFWPDEAGRVAEEIRKLDPALKIAGVGANFACASGVLPSPDNLAVLVGFGKTIEDALDARLEIYSGGATTKSLAEIGGCLFPKEINNLRIGEGYLLGTDSSSGAELPWLDSGALVLEAELAEVRVKPTMPVGETGRDAFGDIVSFEDRGRRLRGILAIGRQDVHIDSLVPLDEGVKIITASSDHLLVDLEDCPARPAVGDILRFRPGYAGMLSLSTSPYVTKAYEE